MPQICGDYIYKNKIFLKESQLDFVFPPLGYRNAKNDSRCEHESEKMIVAMCGGPAGCVSDWWLEKNGSAPQLMKVTFFIFVCQKINRKSTKKIQICYIQCMHYYHTQ